MEQALQNQWAETTLNVIQRIARTEGKRIYKDNWAPRSDLESYLTLEAQKTANKYQPNHDATNPENYWAAYLTSVLTDTARYHWSEWIGTKTSQPAYQTASDANQPWNRIEALITKTNDTLTPPPRMTSIHPQDTTNPEAHYLRTETLHNTLNTLTTTNPTPTTTCIEPNCRNPTSSRNRCLRHAVLHKSLWDNITPCKETHCPDGATTRGWCPRHYQTAYARARRTGQQFELKPKPPTTCTIQGCTKPHASTGLCKTHYGRYRQTLKPNCTTPGCTNKQISRSLCTKHYQQLRAKEKADG